MRIDRKLNLSDPTHYAMLCQELREGNGWHTVTIAPASAKATAAQFGYYFAVVLPIATQFLNRTQGGVAGPDGEPVPFFDDEADQWLKIHLRGRSIVNKKTGEETIIAPSKAMWDVPTMVAFVDEVIDLLVKNGNKVPPPDPRWRELKEQQQRRADALAWAG